MGLPELSWASNSFVSHVDLTHSTVGYVALGIFVLAYALVMAEEFTHLRKSKPVILAAGIIWLLVAASYPGSDPHAVEQALRHNILEYAELMLFFLVAMTYINAMEDRLVFECLRAWFGAQGVYVSTTFLDYGHFGLLYLAVCRQSYHSLAHVRGCPCCRG